VRGRCSKAGMSVGSVCRAVAGRYEVIDGFGRDQVVAGDHAGCGDLVEIAGASSFLIVVYVDRWRRASRKAGSVNLFDKVIDLGHARPPLFRIHGLAEGTASRRTTEGVQGIARNLTMDS